MRVFIHICEVEDIKFLKLNYRTRATATTREERRFYYHGDHIIDWSGYTDDLMLVFNSKEELQKALTLLNNTFEFFHLQINIGKTKNNDFKLQPTSCKYVIPRHNLKYQAD